jgi:CBS domain-containing protein
MTENPSIVKRGAPIREAAEVMAREDIGSLPVVDEGGLLVGMVTDRDIAVRVVAAGLDPGATQVGEVLSGDPVVVFPDDPLDTALDLMAKHQVRRLPVVYDFQPVGVVAQADVAHEAKDKKAGQVLDAISQPSQR